MVIGVSAGINTVEQVVSLEKDGIRPYIGSALLQERLDLGATFAAFAKTDRPDGLFTTVVVDEQGVALGLVYSNHESLCAAINQRKGNI